MKRECGITKIESELDSIANKVSIRVSKQRKRIKRILFISQSTLYSWIKAFAQIPDATALILYSDQGWQYQHKQYQRRVCCFYIAYSAHVFGIWVRQLGVSTSNQHRLCRAPLEAWVYVVMSLYRSKQD